MMRKPRTNLETRAVTTASIVGNTAFAAGVSAYLAGAPVHDLGDRRLQWTYERGRQFAAYCRYRHIRVPPLMTRAGRPSPLAVKIYAEGRGDGSIT